MIKRPGERRIESAAACDGRLKAAGADWTKLGVVSMDHVNCSAHTHRLSAYANTSSVIMTVARWKYTVCQLSYSKLYTLSIAGSTTFAICESIHSKYAKNGG